MKLLISSIGISLFILIVIAAYLYTSPLPLPFSPLSLSPPKTIIQPAYQPVIFGFLPYWNLTKVTPSSFTPLTDLAYFGITVNQNGFLDKQDLGYRRFISNYQELKILTQTNKLNFHLVVKAQGEQELFNFLYNDFAQKNLFQELSSLNSQYPVDGYNIDFEPANATNAATINRFTEFISSFRRAIKPSDHLTIDIYPSAASSPKLWDLPKLKPYTDYFIMMAYDYTSMSDSVSGPVAPVYPPPGKKHALIINLKQIADQIPRQKIIIGLPLYGYEWATLTQSLYTPTLKGTGQLASLGRIQTLLSSTKYPVLKDPITLSSRLLITDTIPPSQIYFEDVQTFYEKAVLARNGDFAGIALWAIGYEGQYPIWPALNQGLKVSL